MTTKPVSSLIESLYTLRDDIQKVGHSRELVLALTKLEECEMWLYRHDEKQLEATYAQLVPLESEQDAWMLAIARHDAGEILDN